MNKKKKSFKCNESIPDEEESYQCEINKKKKKNNATDFREFLHLFQYQLILKSFYVWNKEEEEEEENDDEKLERKKNINF